MLAAEEEDQKAEPLVQAALVAAEMGLALILLVLQDLPTLGAAAAAEVILLALQLKAAVVPAVQAS